MEEKQTKARILIVNSRHQVRRMLCNSLRDVYEVLVAETGRDAVETILDQSVAVVLLDMLLPDTDGLALLRKLKRSDPDLKVIVATAVKEIHTAVRAIKSGAYDYVVEPFDMDILQRAVHRALESHPHAEDRPGFFPDHGHDQRPFEHIVGKEDKMRDIFRFISTVARSDGTVLVQGESGTGKELVARAIHNRSPRWNKPFRVVNCAAVPRTLMERELFGHIRGAFTSATATLPGKLEQADKGTIFLDDIDSIDTSMQAKLLRVIQHKEFERLGSSRLMRVDVRFVAASNKDLRRMISRNRFREDLFFRLNVFPIVLPPLRHRRNDIPLLIDHFLRLHSVNGRGVPKRMTKRALQALMAYDWPGNIRELENLIQRICTVSRKAVVRVRDLPIDLTNQARSNGGSLKEAVLAFERTYIQDVLKSVDGNRQEAARRLGIHRNTLHGKISMYGL